MAPKAHDAAVGDGTSSGDGKLPDGASCAGNTVQACGATCAACATSGARQVPTCDNMMCGIGCVADAPKCSDMSCSQLTFDFEDGTTEGITAVSPANLNLMVGTFNGSKQLAITVASLTDDTISVPVCISGMIDVSTKTLSATVYYQDPNAPTGGQYFLQAWSPAKSAGNNAFVGTASITANVPQPFSAPLSASAFSSTSGTVMFEFGSFGAAFAGTVWFDDITIQ